MGIKEARPLFQVERQERIIKILEEKQNITVDELAKLLNVTAMTIRRDLKSLEDAELISRTFGGAVLKSKLTLEISHRRKEIQRKPEKKAIAIAAAERVEDGHTVILDAGTTTMEIAKQLVHKKALTIITTDVLIAAFFAMHTDFAIYCSGDRVQNVTCACIGSRAVQFLEQVYADIAFIGASSIDAMVGLSTPTPEKAELKKRMIAAAEQAILVADHSKFNKRAFSKICQLEEFFLIISDTGLDPAVQQALMEKNIHVQLV